MNLEELRALFADLLSKGITPMLCDTEVPLYDSPVACGEPNMSYGEILEKVLLPKELLSMHPEFLIPVRGDSMKDVGIETGDIVKVIGDVTPSDGDIVLAYIDGEFTLKTYCEDEDGQHWLVPQNEKYQPILLDDKIEVRIYGRVKEVVKQDPRVSYRQCMKAIRKMKKIEPPKLTRQHVDEAIAAVSAMVKNGRQWYAVFRALVDKKQLGKTDYEAFCDLIASVVPLHGHLPEAGQMKRLAVQSFAKSVALWDENDAPVTGKPFKDYKRIALMMLELLTV